MKNQPTFPIDPTSHNEFDTGMTLRDYFAAKCLQGELAEGIPMRPQDQASIATFAYAMADAMLKARKA